MFESKILGFKSLHLLFLLQALKTVIFKVKCNVAEALFTRDIFAHNIAIKRYFDFSQ